MLEMSTEHIPVLADELLDLAAPLPGDTVIDCTFGAGGHAQLFADRIGSEGLLIAIDRDPAASERFAEFDQQAVCQTRFVRQSFADALEMLAAEGLTADVVYLDLGMSSIQIDNRERGFAYASDAPLDMRMDTEQAFSAADFIAESDASEIARVLKQYGEERHASAIAREIVRSREAAPIRTTSQLVACIERAIPTPARFAGGHPAKRSFQAIRIAVNDELAQIDSALPTAWGVLASGGRLAAISFQSLEDRRVKQFMTGKARGCICPPDLPVCGCGLLPEGQLLNRRAVSAGAAEVDANPRARSAHLRGVLKLGEEQ
ncbi:MAG: 16S rRNA (cytosine(1402)-N(4))-methyltransferase RsmH [Actinomycetes bacterium]